MRVLLTGGRAPATLDLARHLHSGGNEVFLAESQRWPIARWSNAIIRTFRVPPPRFKHAAFTRAICNILEHERIDLLIPTCEEIFFISRHADVFSKHSRVFSDKFALLETLHNKWRFNQIASHSAVKAPRSALIESSNVIEEKVEEFDKYVLKPAYSRFAVHTLFDPRKADLASINPTSTHPWICQERIKGTEYCTYSVARSGTLLAHACYHPKYRAGRASGYYFLPVDVPPITEYVSEFVEAHSFSGQIGFDFIEHASGDLFVLECNPRLTSGAHLFDQSADFNRVFDNQWEGPTVFAHHEPKMIGLAMALMQFPKSVPAREVRSTFTDFNDASDVVFHNDDALPAAGQFIQLAECLTRAVAEGVSPISASTRDIEWDGEPLADFSS